MKKSSRFMETPQVNLTYPVDTLGSRRERTGQEEHATSIILFESYIGNTETSGRMPRQVEVGRQSCMKCRCLHGESDGRSSLRGKATYTRMRTDGEGP